MLIVPDIQDVYTPLESDVIVQLSEVSIFLSFQIISLGAVCFNVIEAIFLQWLVVSFFGEDFTSMFKLNWLVIYLFRGAVSSAFGAFAGKYPQHVSK